MTCTLLEPPPLRIGIVLGSTRPGRLCPAIAGWVAEHAQGRTDLLADLVDLADLDLPLLDEPRPAAMSGRDYALAPTRRWSQIVDDLDGFVFVVPEYNRSFPAALKNAIDYLYVEWHDKVAGFVSYGVDVGGSRAVDQLRIVMGELRVADVRSQVALSLSDDLSDEGVDPREFQSDRLGELWDEVVAWGGALRGLRDHPAPEGRKSDAAASTTTGAR